MPVTLDHLLVPSRDRVAAAQLVAGILGVPWAAQGTAGPFSVVYVNDHCTLDFDQWTGELPKMHYCFRVTEAEFDQVLRRLRDAGLRHRSTPHGPVDDRFSTAFGGRSLYWDQPDGHVWEVLTVSYARQGDGTGSDQATSA